MCVARLIRGLSFITIDTVATETPASLATSRRFTGFFPLGADGFIGRTFFARAGASGGGVVIEVFSAIATAS
jgi:hypothetical protein